MSSKYKVGEDAIAHFVTFSQLDGLVWEPPTGLSVARDFKINKSDASITKRWIYLKISSIIIKIKRWILCTEIFTGTFI